MIASAFVVSSANHLPSADVIVRHTLVPFTLMLTSGSVCGMAFCVAAKTKTMLPTDNIDSPKTAPAFAERKSVFVNLHTRVTGVGWQHAIQ